MPAFTFPHTFHDGTGEVASGVQVMDNLTVLKEHIESQLTRSKVATEESRESAAYGTLGTADQVQVTLTTDALIVVAFQAVVSESVLGAARVALFLEGNQVKFASAAAPAVQETGLGGPNATNFTVVSTCATGLRAAGNYGVSYSGDVTTGQIIGSDRAVEGLGGGPAMIFAAEGTYKLSVRYKASSGKVTAKNRKLWAWVLSP